MTTAEDFTVRHGLFLHSSGLKDWRTGKRILAVSLGLQVPALQEHCVSIGRRHSFDPEFFRLLLA